MDTVSRLLRGAGLEAVLEKHCLLGAGTRMDVPRSRALTVPFHVLLEGECRLHVGRAVFDLRPGDVVLIPSGAGHRVVTAGPGRPRGTVETEGAAFATKRSERGGDPVIDLFCGHFTVNAGAGALLFRSLPGAIHVSFGQSPETDEVLRGLSFLMRGEALREGSGTAAILSALSTVLLAMVLRTARGAATADALWTAVADPGIASAVSSVLEEPGADWTIERLSRQVAMSRATFLRRFVRETGMTVGAFLTWARMMTAAQLLSTSEATVAFVANRVGYQSESAFTRAFRAELGTTPARFRRASFVHRL